MPRAKSPAPAPRAPKKAAASAAPPVVAPPGNPRVGHYEIVERIGAGGMAEAFRAKARGPGGYVRELIIKCILPDLADEPDFVRLFVAEAKILGMLNHPNIVQVYDFGEEDGRHFLALEFLDGPSIAQIISLCKRSQQPMPVGVAAYIAREVCFGLAAAHGLRGPDERLLNVVHRDVTPSNVMTTTAGEVKLVDFGIARLGPPGAATRAGTVRGKPAYLAPEQVLGADIDGRADVFTTGAVLHEMLTLKPLFQGENDLATIYRVMEHEIPRPSVLRDDVPAELDRIVLRALERPPAARYQTATEMAEELGAIVNRCRVGRQDVANFASTYRRMASERRREHAAPTMSAEAVTTVPRRPGKRGSRRRIAVQ